MTRQEFIEDKGIEEQVRDAAGREQQQRLNANRVKYAPPTKGSLVEQAGGKLPEQPVKFTKTPRISAKKPSAAAGTPPTDDLTDILQQSLRAVRKKK